MVMTSAGGPMQGQCRVNAGDVDELSLRGSMPDAIGNTERWRAKQTPMVNTYLVLT